MQEAERWRTAMGAVRGLPASLTDWPPAYVSVKVRCFVPLGGTYPLALMLTLSLFTHLINGFRNQDLRRAVADLLGVTAKAYTAQQATYDLRRLCRKGLVHRREGTQRYVVTPYGWKVARLYARLDARVFRPALTALEGQSVDTPTPKLAQALAKVDHELDTLISSAFPALLRRRKLHSEEKVSKNASLLSRSPLNQTTRRIGL